MKQHPEAAALAARFTEAASTPLPLLLQPTNPAQPTSKLTRSKEATGGDRVPITLRPSKMLLEHYTNAAADRTREIGRVVSAQEIMLEQLERGLQ